MAAKAASASKALPLKEQYKSGTDDQKKKRKNKREKPKSDGMGGVRIVDEELIWQKPVQIEEEEEYDFIGEEKPQIDEDIEVKHMKKLEAIRSQRPYHAISKDGSGWVSILGPSKPLNAVEGGRELSPPRQPRWVRECSLADLSPPRKSRKEVSLGNEARRTGLLSVKDIKDEINQKKEEELSRFASMDPLMSGRGAAPVFRDERGKCISKELLLKSKEEEKPKEKNLEWGKGLAQKREAKARARELELEMDKPFARTRDDPELDKMFKERIRRGDPMAHLVQNKNSESVLEDLGDDEKMKESGFIIPQIILSHSWIKRGLDFSPNRYGIRPGRHWDGVDRSNGYEMELFKRQNEKRATEREAYLWSISNM